MKKYQYLFLLAALLLTGCLKDETTREFKPVEVPVIEEISKKYIMEYGQLLEINPKIQYSDMSGLTFEWIIDGETVSNEQNLSWECTLTQNAPGALYVRRHGSESATIVQFYIELTKPFERGWVVVTEKGGKVTYNFLQEIIGPVYTYKEHPEALVTTSTAESWVDCQEFWCNDPSSRIGHILHLDTDPSLCFSIKSEQAMEKFMPLQKEFIGENFPEGVTFQGALYGGFVGYLWGDNGKLYSRKSEMGFYSGRFSNLPLRFDRAEDLEISSIIGGSYGLGFLLIRDKAADRFLRIKTSFGDISNMQAGLITELPDASAFSPISGQEILYAQLIKPANVWLDSNVSLFIVSKNAAGAITASEFALEANGGDIAKVTRKYAGVPIEGFGEHSVIVAMENPMGRGSDNIYYSDRNDSKILRVARRTSSGLKDFSKFGTFGAEIVSIDQGILQSRSKNIGLGLSDGSFMLVSLVPGFDSYVAPEGENANSLTYKWENLGEKLLKVDFRYGNVGNY